MLELSQQTSGGVKIRPRRGFFFFKAEPGLRKPVSGLKPGNPGGNSSPGDHITPVLADLH